MTAQQARVERAESDSTEARIMRAALRLFATKGYGHVGIREIALEAGVSTAALYHYMRTKEDLLVFLMSDRMRRIMEVGTRARSEFDDPVRQLVALVRIHVITHARFPDEVVDREVRSLSAEGRRTVVALRDQYQRFWDEVLEAGMASGDFRAPSLRFARFALLEMCGGVAQWYSPNGQSSLGEIADAYADLGLAMVGARQRVADLAMPPAQHHADLVAEVYAELNGDARVARARP